MTTTTLIEAVEPYLSQAFRVLPNRLQERVSNALRPLAWDELSPAQRRTALQHSEGVARREHEEEFARAFDLILEIDELETKKDRWRDAPATTVAELVHRDSTLTTLGHRIAELTRQIGSIAANENANAEVLLARYRAAIARNGGSSRGVAAALAVEDGIQRQSMVRRIERAQKRLGENVGTSRRAGLRPQPKDAPAAHPRSNFPSNPYKRK